MKLELYVLEGCPYCRKVEDFIDEKGLRSRIEFHEIGGDEEACERLVELNGQDQVPCLVIDGKPMLESDDIIAWLDENFVKSRKTA